MNTRLIVGLSGVSIISIASLAIIGMIMGTEGLYLWHGNVGMAMNTAVCFVITGTTFILISLNGRF